MTSDIRKDSLLHEGAAKGSSNGADPRHQSREIAIIGMSGRFPGGANSPDLLWQILRTGTDAVGEADGQRWDLGWHHPDPNREERVYTNAGGFLERIDEFDAEFFGISPREARQVDPQHRLLLELTWEALENSSIAPRRQAGSDTGVFIGISTNDYGFLLGPEPRDAYTNTGSALSIAANRISYIFDFHGPSVAVDTACSSSLVCVHQACKSILAGECSTALAGGVNSLINIHLWVGFAKASMLSPTGRCKSFDAGGDGYVRSEGAGLVLLKPLAAAERDGDRILGVILASGVNSDGRTLGLSMPNGEAQERLLRKVYAQCGVPPEEVFYVEAHGTGTSVGDPIECESLGRVLGQPRTDGSRCLIGSIKSNIGHLEAASGVAGLTKVLLALKHREIPGNLHFCNPNPKIDFENWKLEVVAKNTPLPASERPLVIGINSFGFGGTNAHVVVQEYRPAHAQRPAAQPPATDFERVLVLSGHTPAALQAVAGSYMDLLSSPSKPGWEEICAAAATCRSMQRYRLAVAAATAEEARDRLESYLGGQPVRRLASGVAPAGTASIAFVYSGNGPQWWGMGRELLAGNEIFRREIETIDEVFAPLAGWSLLEEMRRPEQENRIALTEYAQPLLFAQQLGLTKLLREAGIHPSAVLGHSVGEVAAAYASGALSLEQATKVIYHRSKAQARTAGQGRMAALGIGAAEAQEVMRGISGWLEIAGINSPESITVAGDPSALEQMINALTQAGKFARLLQLNYPFHTKAMGPIREELLDGLHGLAPAESKVPFISTVEGAEIAGQQLDAEYWYRNVREPVQFSGAVTHLLTDREVGVFLEIGPHPVLREYVQQSARSCGSSAVALQTLRRPGAKGPEPELDNFWTAVCACHAHGVTDLDSIFRRPVPPPALPLYPWQKVQHWRGKCLLPDIVVPIERDHPLLGHRTPSTDGLWENTLDTNQIKYLKDHVIQGAVLFPAAGYIELAFAAGERLMGQGVLDIENLDILRPLAIPAHGDPLVQVGVDAKDGSFEIRSRPNLYSTDWSRQVRGRVSRMDAVPAEASLPLAEIASRLPIRMDADVAQERYRATAARGLVYGEAFQGITRLWLSDPNVPLGEALARIHLAHLSDSELSVYRAHPTLLDSCLQVLGELNDNREKQQRSLIPVFFGRVRSLAPLPATLFCYVRMRKDSDRSVVADLRVTDPEGNVLLIIEESRYQKLDFRQAMASPIISEWWRPDPNAQVLASLPGLPTPSLPSPSKTLAAIKADVERIAQQSHCAAFYRELRPKLDLLAGAYVARAIDALWPSDESLDPARLAQSGGIPREQLGLLTQLLRLAEEEGRISGKDGVWRRNSHSLSASPEAMWRELFYEHPAYQAELLLFAQAGDNLTATLHGEASQNAAADSGATLFDQLYDTSPFQALYNRFARTAVEALVKCWPEERPLRILEVGGGGGGLAAWLLPTLPLLRTDYCFTDPSEAATARAEHRFSAHRFARFSTLDLQRDFIEQGQPAGYFDIVVAANAAHTAGDPDQLLLRLQKVMAGDGQLLMIEAHADRLTDLIFSHSPKAQPDPSPLRDASTWLRSLAAAGYQDAVAFSDSTACPPGESTRQSVFLARRGAVNAPAAISTEAAGKSDAPRRWLIVVEEDHQPSSAFHEKLLEDLRANGHSATLRSFAPGDAHLETTILNAWTEDPADSVVYLSGASAPGGDGQSLLDNQAHRCLTALYLVRALEATRKEAPVQLTLVTRGAFSTACGQGPLDPAQAPLWGLGRVIANEQPGLNCRLIDVHCSTQNSAAAASWLAAELMRRDEETEVQLLAGYRFVNRERLMTLNDEARNAAAIEKARADSFVLDFRPAGGLDSLYLRAVDRKAPGPNEVEIAVRAAGLNFRDVLWSMGMLPEEAVENGFSGPTIGMECAGEIVRVGAGVTELKPGDRVVAFASSCFAGHVTTHTDSVGTMPSGMDFSEAATIPTAFLTAYYALDHLARLAPGEAVLIHGAAGGVGLAAIQIAKLKGAKVFGTAGSARKRRMLEMLGVDHALNSRSLDFADEVMRLTGGVGVDVVLNSLAGEAITKSLNCLRPFGRFLEIGKRDLYANSRIGLRPFRNNLSYFAIDADTLLIERPDLARWLFKTVIDLFRTEALRPLPFQSIPISRASEAFRAMQQSRHVGKLILRMDAERPETLPVVRTRPVARPGATYLVTGGLGGFGLATAKWLVGQGATSLALLGRRGANTEEAIAGIAEMEKAGATVKAFAADIADAESLATVLSTVRATMPPLVGVVHSAAVIEDAPILQIGSEQLTRVLTPKILGAWNLHEATLQDSIEMFVLYSSSSTVIGNPGQGAYVAGNLYLDSLAQYRRSLGLPGLAVGWGAIKDAGFLTRHTAVAEMLRSRTGLDATPSSEALQDLGRLSSVGSTRVCVARVDLQRLGQALPGVLVPRFYPIITEGAVAALHAEESLADRLAATPEAERREMVLNSIREHAARVLGTGASQLDAQRPLADLGLDSLMAVELAVAVERDLAQPVSVMQLLSAGTIAAIVELVIKMLGVEIKAERTPQPEKEREVLLEVSAGAR